jgi:hypothetical protein
MFVGFIVLTLLNLDGIWEVTFFHCYYLSSYPLHLWKIFFCLIKKERVKGRRNEKDKPLGHVPLIDNKSI